MQFFKYIRQSCSSDRSFGQSITPSQRAVIEMHVSSPQVNFPSSQKNLVLTLSDFSKCSKSVV